MPRSAASRLVSVTSRVLPMPASPATRRCVGGALERRVQPACDDVQLAIAPDDGRGAPAASHGFDDRHASGHRVRCGLSGVGRLRNGAADEHAQPHERVQGTATRDARVGGLRAGRARARGRRSTPGGGCSAVRSLASSSRCRGFIGSSFRCHRPVSRVRGCSVGPRPCPAIGGTRDTRRVGALICAGGAFRPVRPSLGVGGLARRRPTLGRFVAGCGERDAVHRVPLLARRLALR